MPGYVEKLLARFKHERPKKPVDSPYKAPPRVFGKDAQNLIPIDSSPKLDEKGKLCIQQVLGTCLYYARAIDNTILPGLSAIASEQATPTERTAKCTNHLLDYLATHPEAKVRYYVSDMILNVHSDASYLSESRTRSRIAGYFFMGSTPEDGKPIKMNGNTFVNCGILKFVVTSAAEPELGALFLNMKESNIICLALEEMGHRPSM